MLVESAACVLLVTAVVTKAADRCHNRRCRHHRRRRRPTDRLLLRAISIHAVVCCFPGQCLNYSSFVHLSFDIIYRYFLLLLYGITAQASIVQ